MIRVELPFALQIIAEKSFVDCDDVAQLRDNVFGQGVVSPGEAEALFWLNECVPGGAPEWGEYFAEAVSDHFVHHQWPQGYMDDAGTDRLATRILKDGRISSANELELLVRVIEKSARIPDQLVLFALGEVRAAVFIGQEPGIISEAQVAITGRVVNALAAQGCLAVSRAGAEILFDLNRRLAESADQSGWARVFINAIAGYVLAGRGPARSAGQAQPAGRRTTQEEAEWLVSRISREGGFSKNERELLHYIGSEADQIHPALKALINKAA